MQTLNHAACSHLGRPKGLFLTRLDESSAKPIYGARREQSGQWRTLRRDNLSLMNFASASGLRHLKQVVPSSFSEGDGAAASRFRDAARDTSQPGI